MTNNIAAQLLEVFLVSSVLNGKSSVKLILFLFFFSLKASDTLKF